VRIPRRVCVLIPAAILLLTSCAPGPRTPPAIPEPETSAPVSIDAATCEEFLEWEVAAQDRWVVANGVRGIISSDDIRAECANTPSASVTDTYAALMASWVEQRDAEQAEPEGPASAFDVSDTLGFVDDDGYSLDVSYTLTQTSPFTANVADSTPGRTAFVSQTALDVTITNTTAGRTTDPSGVRISAYALYPTTSEICTGEHDASAMPGRAGEFTPLADSCAVPLSAVWLNSNEAKIQPLSAGASSRHSDTRTTTIIDLDESTASQTAELLATPSDIIILTAVITGPYLPDTARWSMSGESCVVEAPYADWVVSVPPASAGYCG